MKILQLLETEEVIRSYTMYGQVSIDVTYSQRIFENEYEPFDYSWKSSGFNNGQLQGFKINACHKQSPALLFIMTTYEIDG